MDRDNSFIVILFGIIIAIAIIFHGFAIMIAFDKIPRSYTITHYETANALNTFTDALTKTSAESTKDILTLEEAAQLLKISRNDFQWLIDNPDSLENPVPHVKFGTSYVFSKESLTEWFKNQTEAGLNIEY